MSASRTRAKEHDVRSFEPVLGDAPAVLVLGSAPGIRSLEDAEYYAHPRNAFWPIMQRLFGVDPAAPYRARLDALADAGVALWDVVGTCVRTTSLDSRIDGATIEVNDIAGLLTRAPSIRAVFLNGGRAWDEYRKRVAPHVARAVLTARLPSTSPAYAAMSFEAKADAWVAVRDAVERARDERRAATP